jgi:ParB family chromosome partitioning protein
VVRRGLGRGLNSLIPTTGEEVEVREIPIDDINPSPYQPRQNFDEQAFGELVASVKEYGLIQPIVVRPVGASFELIAGERRWRAAKEAGLKRLPAIIKPSSDIEALEMALIENIQREDLDALEEAAAYYQLIQEFNLTQEELSKRVGKSRSTVANTLRLLQLPDPVKKLIREKKISSGHARALLALPDEKSQMKMAQRIIADGLTVRQAENMAVFWQNKAEARRKKSVEKPELFKEYEKVLGKKFNTKVIIRFKDEKGKVEIAFNSREELVRIVNDIVNFSER